MAVGGGASSAGTGSSGGGAGAVVGGEPTAVLVGCAARVRALALRAWSFAVPDAVSAWTSGPLSAAA